MTTECNGKLLEFHPLGLREARADFEGGVITSDAGGLLLREVEKRTGIVERFAGCFTDHRDAERIEHTVGELVAQRVYGLALGYEGLNDHDPAAAGGGTRCWRCWRRRKTRRERAGCGSEIAARRWPARAR